MLRVVTYISVIYIAVKLPAIYPRFEIKTFPSETPLQHFASAPWTVTTGLIKQRQVSATIQLKTNKNSLNCYSADAPRFSSTAGRLSSNIKRDTKCGLHLYHLMSAVNCKSKHGV